MDETVVKKDVERNCWMCFHCRMRITVNLNDVMATLLVPQNRREGIAYIRCRKNYWDDVSRIPKLLFNTEYVRKLKVVCPHFEGEEDEKDNSTI